MQALSESISTAHQMRMSVEELIDENVKLRDDNERLSREHELQRSQISNLSNINVFAGNIAKLSSSTPVSTSKEMMKRRVMEFVTDARVLVLSGCRDVDYIARRMVDLVTRICGFVWDHLGEIATAAVVVPAITVCAGAAALMVAAGTGAIDSSVTMLSHGDLMNLIATP